MVGGGVGRKAGTCGEFVTARDQAIADTKNLHVLNVLLDPKDRSTAKPAWRNDYPNGCRLGDRFAVVELSL